MKRLQLIVGFGLAMLSSLVFAAPITGVTATTSFADPADGASQLSNIVDGSGLTSYTLGATHAAGDPTNAWADGLGGKLCRNMHRPRHAMGNQGFPTGDEHV